MKKEKFALISSEAPSLWASCRVITPNLLGAYRLAYPNKMNHFSFTSDQSPGEIQDLAIQIFSSSPSKIIFIDHHPHPETLIMALRKVFGVKKFPPIYFHIYGDFTHFSEKWFRMEEALMNQPVAFICASSRQKNLIISFVRNGSDTVQVCPFPVSSSNYFFDEKSRSEKRKKLKLKDQDRLIVYAGRLCLQKNVLRLIQETVRYMESSRTSVILQIAGFFDDVSSPFFGRVRLRGSYFHDYSQVLSQIPDSLKDRVQYLGSLEAAKLRELYNAADLFMSLSTYHDEDYGMSPVEALFCGCPVLLSDWGGFADFAMDPGSSQFVPIQMGDNGLFMKSSEIQKALKTSLTMEADRAERASGYQAQFSISAIAKILLTLHSAEVFKFEGFSSVMKTHVKRKDSSTVKQDGLFKDGFGKNSFYHKIYKNYLRELK